MSRTTILFGGPGTGKTTRLIRIVKDTLHSGIKPERIAYMSFSKKAAEEAGKRASNELGLSSESLPWFRTLHSAAFKLLELNRTQVMSTPHYREFGKKIGMLFSGTYDADIERVPIDVHGMGDRCLALYSRAKARRWSLEQEWRFQNDWNLPFSTLDNFVKNFESFKKSKGLVDFTDMIDMVTTPIDVDVFILDEAQDNSLQQWECGRLLARLAKQVYIGGDDDQAIYGFSGSTAMPLLTLNAKREVLPISHRLPISIKKLADGVAARIKIREPKTFSSRLLKNGTLAKGKITWLREPDEIDLSHGTWLLLCRNRSQIPLLESIARQKNVVYLSRGIWSNKSKSIQAVLIYERLRSGGVATESQLRILKVFIPEMKYGTRSEYHKKDIVFPFNGDPTWMDALELPIQEKEYIRGLRRRGESLNGTGRVEISTVHGAKGGEAENVVLMTDISRRVAAGRLRNPDSENRVLYVGVSRAIENMYLVKPTSVNFWEI